MASAFASFRSDLQGCAELILRSNNEVDYANGSDNLRKFLGGFPEEERLAVLRAGLGDNDTNELLKHFHF